MTSEEKIHILCQIKNLDENLKEVLLNLFSDESLVVYFEENETVTYNILITDSLYEGEIKKVVYLSDDESLAPRVSLSMLELEVVQISLKRFVGLDSTLNIDNLYEGDFKNFKITDPFTVGHYQDVIGSYLYKNNFDHKRLALSYQKIVRTLIDKLELLPVEVDFVRGENYVALQIHASVSKLQMTRDEIVEFINEIDIDLIDTYYLKSSKELVFNSILINESKGNCLLFSDIDKFNELNPNLNFYENTESFVKTDKDEVDFKFKNTDNLSTIEIVRKVIDWLKDRKNLKGDHFFFESELLKFPDQDLLAKLNEDDHIFIKKVLNDYKIDEAYKFSISGATEKMNDDKEVISKVSKSLEGLDEYEVASLFEDEEGFQRVLGSKDDTQEDVTKIEGVTDDLSEENQLVKGSKEEKEDVLRIKGSFDEIKNEMISFLSKRFEGEVPDIQDIRSEIERLCKKKLGLDENQASRLAEKVVSSAAVESMVKESQTESREAIFIKMENEKLKSENLKKDLINKKLKQLIDSMREQLNAVREADKEILSIDPNKAEDKAKRLEQIVSFKTRELKAKEISFERKEHVLLNQLNQSELRVELLEKKLSEVKSEKSDIIQEKKKDDNEVQVLQIENERLEQTITNLENKNTELLSSLEKVKSELEQSIEGSISSEELRAEQEKNNFLEKKVKELTSALSKKVEESKDVTIAPEQAQLQDELEEQKKVMSLEVKKYEQKIKLLNGKIIELEKVASKAKGSVSGQASNVKVKQLEKNLDKIREQKDKAMSELAEKKKEAHSYKQESSLLQNKLTELEKKLAKFEKKAA